jgi:hypothetical protein
MKSIVKRLTGLGYVLLIAGIVGFTLYIVSASNTLMKGKFDWDMPLVPVKAVAALLLILLVANARPVSRNRVRVNSEYSKSLLAVSF